MGQVPLIIEASRSHSDTPHSVGLLWTSDQPDADTSTWQPTALTTDFHGAGGIRSHNSSKRTAADPHRRPRVNRDRQLNYLASLNVTCTELTMDKEACRLLPFCLVVFNRCFGGINCFHLRSKTEGRAGNVRVRIKETERMAWLPERTNWIQCDIVCPVLGPIKSLKKVRMWKCRAGKLVKEFLRNVKRENWRVKKRTCFYTLMWKAVVKLGISPREASEQQLTPRSADVNCTPKERGFLTQHQLRRWFKNIQPNGTWPSYTVSSTKAIPRLSAKWYVAFLRSTIYYGYSKIISQMVRGLLTPYLLLRLFQDY